MASSAGHGVSPPVASHSGLQVMKKAKTPGSEARREKATRQFTLPSGLAGQKDTCRWAPQGYETSQYHTLHMARYE